MRIASFLSSLGGSPLQGGIERGLVELGHSVERYQPGQGYDLIIVFQQVAHDPAYCWPEFPACKTPIAFVDAAEFGYFTRLPDRAHRYANSFTEAAMTHDTKNEGEQRRLKAWLEGRSFPYLLREFSWYVNYPASYHPIDYPLYWKSVYNERPNRENYLARDLEVFCSWGASHPWRLNITEALRAAHRKAEISVIEEMQGGVPTPRMNQGLYFARMQSAKCCPSFDGYGSGSFRMTEVLCRTLLLQGPLSIKTRAPLVDGVTCRMYDVESDGETFLGTNIAEVMADALADPEGSFRIFEAGYDHCMTHLTERATAQYVLDVVAAHDWGKPTVLEV